MSATRLGLRLLACMLALALLAPLGPLTARAGAEAPPSLPDIERQVMCPVCGVPLNLADSPQADRERTFIRALIARGQNTSQIKRALVAQFGQAVLALPPSSGFDLAAYLVPLAVVGGMVVVLALMLPRWRRRTRASAAPAPSLSPGDAQRLDEDLARYDL